MKKYGTEIICCRMYKGKYVMFSTTVEVYSIQFVSPLRFTIHLETDLLSFYFYLCCLISNTFNCLLVFFSKENKPIFMVMNFCIVICWNKIHVLFGLKKYSKEKTEKKTIRHICLPNVVEKFMSIRSIMYDTYGFFYIFIFINTHKWRA